MKKSRPLAPYKMAEMHGRFGGGCTGPCREMVLVERFLLVKKYSRAIGHDGSLNVSLCRERWRPKFKERSLLTVVKSTGYTGTLSLIHI